ncbi:unnamed protein product [Rhizopus microsporus]
MEKAFCYFEVQTVTLEFLLVNGRAGKRDGKFDLLIQVYCNDFPPTQWPCVDSYFKALVHLVPGPNTITFAFVNVTLHFHVNYLPLLQNPPLSLAIIIGSDSPATFDVPPEKEGQNTLDVAIRKLRMAGYMWQAFCAEQMYRNGMQRRTFRLDEDWLPDTTSCQENRVMRTTAKVHIIRSTKTVAEIRDIRRAQQRHDDQANSEDLESLFGICLNDLGRYSPFNQPCHVACMLLDAHWDPQRQAILGHAALGGGGGDIALGIFGSHSLHAWPSCIEDIVPCFMNDTRTDTRFIANDAGESGTWWKALNIGMGAMLHEVGHSYTLDHTPSGIMSRGFNNWNRTFMAKEPGHSPIPPEDEEGSHWHRVDVIRLRFHPAFRLPQDGPRGAINHSSPTIMPLEENCLRISVPAGLSMIVYSVNSHYRTHTEFLQHQPKNVTLSLSDIYKQLQCNPNDNIKLETISVNQQGQSIDSVATFFHTHIVQLPGLSSTVFKSPTFGGMEGGSKYLVPFISDAFKKQLVRIVIHHGDFLDGFILYWSDGTRDTVGCLGGRRSTYDVLPGESIQGLLVRCGAWIDGIQFKLSSGKTSPWYGGQGGSPVLIEPPSGYNLIGVHASSGNWMYQIGILYQKHS